jgi:translation initiation factor 6 (eIF-6)
MGHYLQDIYRSPNIGIFLKANDRVLLVPKGLAPSKCEKLGEDLGVSVVPASIAGSRLLGPLAAMNNNGVLLSHLAEPDEMREIARGTGLNVVRLDSKYTALGNLIAANDKHALVSPIIDSNAAGQVKDVLGTEVERMAIQEYVQVGALVVADSRFGLAALGPVDGATPNLEELAGAGEPPADDAAVVEAAEALRARLGARFVAATRGSDGITLVEEGALPFHVPVFGTDQVADVTGAGDTVLATLTLTLAAGGDPREAAVIANLAGGIVVTKLGTATVAPEELHRAIDAAPFIHE